MFHRRILLASFAILVLIISFVTTVYFLKAKEKAEPTGKVLGGAGGYIEAKAPEDKSTLNVLLLGYGGAGHQGGHLTDVIQVLHFDFTKKLVAMISLPRDLWVRGDPPLRWASKINALYAKNTDSASEIKSAIKEITGLETDYFVSVDFVGLQRLIGIELKGIEVVVGETLDDPWYPIKGEELNTCGLSATEVASLSNQYSGFELEKQFACRYEHLNYKEGKVKMEGGDVLKYVRSRHGSGAGDFSRSRRQHEVLLAIKDKVFSLQFLEKLPQVFASLNKHVTTDIDLSIAEHFAPAIKLADGFQVQTIVLSTDNVFISGKNSSGQFVLEPKKSWAEVQSFVKKELER